jgi:hypothetical protein
VRLVKLTVGFVSLVLADIFGTLEVLKLAFVHRHTYATFADSVAFWLAYLLVIVVYVFLLRLTIRTGRRLRTTFASRFARPSKAG